MKLDDFKEKFEQCTTFEDVADVAANEFFIDINSIQELVSIDDMIQGLYMLWQTIESDAFSFICKTIADNPDAVAFGWGDDIVYNIDDLKNYFVGLSMDRLIVVLYDYYINNINLYDVDNEYDAEYNDYENSYEEALKEQHDYELHEVFTDEEYFDKYGRNRECALELDDLE